ncbi:serine hydrolase [Rhodosalinus sp. K401]|uniref:D-alanyl-D-alanine carboxypeptidase family protein n=1 Tax=Rhodosalinus sp. K401 TaxID=3239195 RepID=UPI003525BDEA
MARVRRQPARWGLYFIAFVWLVVVVPLSAAAAPYAAMVMDARTGEVLHSRNADTRLHPASLTKMMTLYVVFEAVENGEIGLDDLVTISRKAAAEPPSKLGLRAGQKIKLRYLIRAAAVKSGNDTATALAEAISGSEAAFARRMNRTAKAIGMTRTTFKNAHGLTQEGHLSTARDMTILGRQLFYDYPEYYNLFSRRSTHAGVKTVPNTNRRLLDAYRGADGIKTGYTRAAGFNLVASAERGGERIIATVFGGHSTAWRNQRVAELLDMGFARAPTRVAVHRPARPPYLGNTGPGGASGTEIRVSGLVARSVRPMARPRPAETVPVAVASAQVIDSAVAEVLDASVSDVLATVVGDPDEQVAEIVAETVRAEPAQPVGAAASTAGVAPKASVPPETRPETLQLASAAANERAAETAEDRVVTRLSTSGGRQWGVNLGRYPTRTSAEKVLLTTALAEMSTLDGALRKVVQRNGGFEANFHGLTRDGADRACRRLQARGTTCFMVGPPS